MGPGNSPLAVFFILLWLHGGTKQEQKWAQCPQGWNQVPIHDQLYEKRIWHSLVPEKMGSSCHFCPDGGQDKKHQAFRSFQSEEVSVRYFSGRHMYVLILLQTSWHKLQTGGVCWCPSLITVSELGLSPVLTTTVPCWVWSWLHPVRLAPKQVNIGLQGTMKTYLEVVGSQHFVKAHGLTLSDLSCPQAVVLGLFIPWAGVWTFSVANKPLGEKLALLKYVSGPLRSSSWVSRGA